MFGFNASDYILQDFVIILLSYIRFNATLFPEL
jgi:hypothetical protein